MCEIYSKLAEKKSTGVSIINFEQISHIVLVFPLLTMSK